MNNALGSGAIIGDRLTVPKSKPDAASRAKLRSPTDFHQHLPLVVSLRALATEQ